MKWHQRQLTTAPVSSPTCSYRTSSPLEKSQPSISRMPARGTYKSPKGVWQPVTTPSATSSFLQQLPLMSSGRNYSAASADGAPQEYAHAQIQPAEPTPPSRRGSCLGSHASERPHTTNTQKKCMDKYTGTSVTGIQLSCSTKRPSSWLELFRPRKCFSSSCTQCLCSSQKVNEFKCPEGLWTVTLQSVEFDIISKAEKM